MSTKFDLQAPFKPSGDQPKAITELLKGLRAGQKHNTLLGVTGSGKTYVAANIIQELQRPALIISHNKTLSAQLHSEFKEFFPNNAVHYFVSYYDYYQPEAYMPASDTYIEKDAKINEEISKMRHAATAGLLTRRDVIIIASVSCIYGLGSKETYENLKTELKAGEQYKRDELLRRLTDQQYIRSNLEFKQGMFHVLGDLVEIFPPGQDTIYRLDFFGDELESITEIESITGEVVKEHTAVTIFPAKHDVTTHDQIKLVEPQIRADLEERYIQLKKMGKNLEAERIKTRTEYDLELLLETGYCNGIENYTRYLSGLNPGQAPSTLMDYFPDDYLLFVDESHITIPQIGAMHSGNLSRKNTLIEHGFRLPSSQDNRPLTFEEFEKRAVQSTYVSATPGKYEMEKTKSEVVELVVRPTGLVDPPIDVRPTKGQIQNLMEEMQKRIDRKERTLITTLTKRQSEDLADFLIEAGFKVKYLHSDIDTLERVEILRDLRLGKFDILVGINLLREGLDLPEVSLVAVMDADKQGFLRSRPALIQTSGRAARNVNGLVIMYADVVTDAMQATLDETARRRKKQIAYNKEHGITPQTIIKAVRALDHTSKKGKKDSSSLDIKNIPKDGIERLIKSLEAQMDIASQNLEFEKAAELRDQIDELQEEL